MTIGEHSDKNGRGYRLRTILLLMPAIAIFAGLMFGFRTGVAGGGPSQIESDITFGALAALVLVLLLGGIHVFRAWSINWRMLLVNMYSTSILSMFIYTIIERETLLRLVPGINDGVAAETTHRIVIGGLDGLLYGSVISLFMSLLDQRKMRFSRTGIIRYIVIYILFAGGFVLITLFDLSSQIADRFSSILLICLTIALKAGIDRWDKRHPAHQQGSNEEAG